MKLGTIALLYPPEEIRCNPNATPNPKRGGSTKVQ